MSLRIISHPGRSVLFWSVEDSFLQVPFSSLKLPGPFPCILEFILICFSGCGVNSSQLNIQITFLITKSFLTFIMSLSLLPDCFFYKVSFFLLYPSCTQGYRYSNGVIHQHRPTASNLFTRASLLPHRLLAGTMHGSLYTLTRRPHSQPPLRLLLLDSR